MKFYHLCKKAFAIALAFSMVATIKANATSNNTELTANDFTEISSDFSYNLYSKANTCSNRPSEQIVLDYSVASFSEDAIVKWSRRSFVQILCSK